MVRQIIEIDQMNNFNRPLFSIIMPSFNQADYIEQAIESVLAQSYDKIELIVGDGGSSDHTVEILKRHSTEDHRLRWTSAPDFGPAHALNKCFRAARGQIIGWLNSDDLYVPEAVAKAHKALTENPHWILCYGQGEYVDESGGFLSRYPTQRPSIGMSKFRDGCFICQPTVFFKTVMLTLIGDLNTSYLTAFDYEYWIRAFNAFPERIGFIDSVLAQSRLHEDCITNKMRETVALEGLKLGRDYLGGAQVHWAVTYLEELQKQTTGDFAAFQTQARSFIQKSEGFLSALDHQAIISALDQGLSR